MLIGIVHILHHHRKGSGAVGNDECIFFTVKSGQNDDIWGEGGPGGLDKIPNS